MQKNMQNTRKQSIIIASINVTKNIVLYSGYIPCA